MATVKMTDRRLEMHYLSQGEGSPLFLLTGLMGSIDFYWKALAPQLAQDFTLIMCDNRASGKTKDDGAPFTINDMVEDTIAFIRHFGHKKVHLFGHSMGAGIAQLLAHRYSSEIDKVILCNSFPRMEKTPQMVFGAAVQLLQAGVPSLKRSEISSPTPTSPSSPAAMPPPSSSPTRSSPSSTTFS
jgi:3-oxoadipate enol-lactonase